MKKDEKVMEKRREKMKFYKPLEIKINGMNGTLTEMSKKRGTHKLSTAEGDVLKELQDNANFEPITFSLI